MSHALPTLLAAPVGAMAALGAQALGPLVTARRAHLTWQRDKRAELWERFMELLSDADKDLDKEILRQNGSQPDGDEAGEQDEEAADGSRSLWIEMRRVESLLRIYGSDRLVEDLKAASDSYMKARFFKGHIGPKQEFDEWSHKVQ